LKYIILYFFEIKKETIYKMSLSKPIFPQETESNNTIVSQKDMEFLNNIWTNTSSENSYLDKIAKLETLLKEREEQLRNSVNINNGLRGQLRNYDAGMARGNYTLNGWIHYARNLEQEIKRKEAVIQEKDRKATRLIEIIREKNRELGNLRTANEELRNLSPCEDMTGRLEMIATIVNTNKMSVVHRVLVNQRRQEIDDFIKRCNMHIKWCKNNENFLFKNSSNLTLPEYLEVAKKQYYQDTKGEITKYGFLKHLEEITWDDIIEFRVSKDDHGWLGEDCTFIDFLKAFLEDGW